LDAALGWRAPHHAVKAASTAGVVVWIATFACATYVVRVPADVRGYEIVVQGTDTLSRAFARALSDAGLKVRSAPRGGTRPAAALVHFVFQEQPDGPAVLYARLADTRTGLIVAAAEEPLDSAVAAGPRAASLVRLLLAPRL
jgi:hypothetical protein